MRVLLLISIFSLEFHSGLGQSQYRFHHFDSRDGLGFDDAVFICQDSLGFIWISNERGLSRYEGYNFKVYKHDSISSPGREWIDRIEVDREGNLWIVRSARGLILLSIRLYCATMNLKPNVEIVYYKFKNRKRMNHYHNRIIVLSQPMHLYCRCI